MARQSSCAVCGARSRLEAHHVIPRSKLKYELGPEAARVVEWDPRNGMTLCWLHHGNHTSRCDPVCLELISHENWQFAYEHGLEWYLERMYPIRDPEEL